MATKGRKMNRREEGSSFRNAMPKASNVSSALSGGNDPYYFYNDPNMTSQEKLSGSLDQGSLAREYAQQQTDPYAQDEYVKRLGDMYYNAEKTGDYETMTKAAESAMDYMNPINQLQNQQMMSELGADTGEGFDLYQMGVDTGNQEMMNAGLQLLGQRYGQDMFGAGTQAGGSADDQIYNAFLEKQKGIASGTDLSDKEQEQAMRMSMLSPEQYQAYKDTSWQPGEWGRTVEPGKMDFNPFRSISKGWQSIFGPSEGTRRKRVGIQ